MYSTKLHNEGLHNVLILGHFFKNQFCTHLIFFSKEIILFIITNLPSTLLINCYIPYFDVGISCSFLFSFLISYYFLRKKIAAYHFMFLKQFKVQQKKTTRATILNICIHIFYACKWIHTLSR